MPTPGELALAAKRAVRGFAADRVLLRAAALTYLTIVSMVPLVAVALQLLQALRFVDLREEVRSFVLTSLAVGARETVEPHLDQMLTAAGARAAGTLGFLLLLVTAILLLRNIERAFAELWGIEKARPIWARVPVYLGVLLAGPVALGLSLVITAALRTFAEVHRIPGGALLLVLASLLVAVGGFTAIYQIGPTAKVRFRAALAGGLFAGVVWELAKHLYATYAARALRTDILYGPLGALPLFFIWVYVSWLVTLFGARLAYAVQHPGGLLLLEEDRAATRAVELSALRVAVACAAAARPVGLHELSASLHIPEALVRRAAQDLDEVGVVELRRRRVRLLLPKGASVGEVLARLRPPGRIPAPGEDPVAEHLARRLDEADGLAAGLLATETLDAAGRTLANP